MFERELVVSGLKRQQSLLDDLIERLESKPAFDMYDHDLYDERTKRIASNLRKLRKIKQTYFNFQ